jgi:tRNA pseudouridine38-40 synthase
MIGYAGTGYKGMQVNGNEKTIEADLFAAFVSAGAISKANADDPKKSSLVRCARTDKGVHAAGNVISLKLIIEDPDIVQKVNESLPPQIRVWGIQRTNNAFSCYQACESRWYEYLLPSYCLLPPHPNSYIWGQMLSVAKEKGAYEELQASYEDIKNFWEEIDEKEIKPILDGLDAETRATVLERIHAQEESHDAGLVDVEDGSAGTIFKKIPNQVTKSTAEEPAEEDGKDTRSESAGAASEAVDSTTDAMEPPKREPGPVDFALKDIKYAYIDAKRRYRISPVRLQRLQGALNKYVGTKNFWNYTTQKTFTDPSAKRHIKSFIVEPDPVVIGKTEWLSLKVHGQSFMMHQIRKMVGMAVLLVRCGAPLERINESYGPSRIAIPKAPGLGLWLERPVFEMYNRKAETLQHKPIDFRQWDRQIREFKDREIYKRIFDVEERSNT